MRHRGRFLNQDVERGSGDQFATVSANLPSTTPANASPAQAAAQSNPHRRPTTHQPPRVLSSEAFGRRPPTRLYRSTTGRHPKPFTIPDLPSSGADQLAEAFDPSLPFAVAGAVPNRTQNRSGRVLSPNPSTSRCKVCVVWEAVPRCEKPSFSANTIGDRNR